MYKRILIPTDGSALSQKAVDEGVKFAQSVGAEVRAVIATPSFLRDTRKLAKKALDAVKKAASAAGVPCNSRHVVSDHPFEAIIKTAKRDRCDLIFMASHGRKGVSGLLLGSETAKVLTHSKIPVLVCR
jgi:nucleotide-binding universal stress UspA family protein